MDVLLVARTNLNGFYPARLVNRNGKNKVPVRVGSAGRKSQWLSCRQDQVRLTQPPSFNKFRARRQVFGISFDRSLLDPVGDALDLSICQPTLIGELQLLWLGQPGRHAARPRHLGDLPRMFFDIGVRQQGKGRSLARPVARRARMKNDWRDVSIESDLWRGGGRWNWTHHYQQDRYERQGSCEPKSRGVSKQIHSTSEM